MQRTESPLVGFGSSIVTAEQPLVERGREIFHPDNGVSWYEGDEAPDLDIVYSELWLPNHSLTLVDKLDQYGGITLVGTVGAGKSTLFYGAKAIMRAKRIPYLGINGHYTNTPAEDVTAAIDCAERNGAAVMYDSADYLVSAHRKLRSSSLERHISRNSAILRSLIDFRQRGGDLLLSSHHQDWVDDRAHPDLFPLWTELTDHTVREEVEITLHTVEEREVLLRKMGLDTNTARFISRLPHNSKFLDYIIHRWGDHKYTDWAQRELSSYQMLKLLAKDAYGENEPVIDTISEAISTDQAGEDSWKAVLEFIFSKTYRLVFFSKLI